MTASKASLIIPVESQVRELEPKILLACVAARRGFATVIGSRLEVDFHIASLARGIYLSKSMTERSVKMFGILRKLGHEIGVWDEEALVHMQPQTYFTRRLSARAIGQVSHFFAWGEENAELWRQYPHFPGRPIHVTGNPRGDMLRPALHGYYRDEARQRRQAYGDFVLVNTNFSNVNAYNPSQNLFLPTTKAGETPAIGRGGTGMSRAYAAGLRDHKQAIFEHLRQLIPVLAAAFPQLNVVVRPHPTEDPRPYRRLAADCERVHVMLDGNVIPWLMATRALVHNGCTTGVEAHIMGVPALAYQPVVNEYYDYGYYRLPNLLSHQCFDRAALCDALGEVLAGTRGSAGGEQREQLLAHHLTARAGPLACERIVDALEGIVHGRPQPPAPPFAARFDGWLRATRRRAVKALKARLPESKYRPQFQRHRYPGLTLDEMRQRVARFQQLLGDPGALRTEQLRAHIFRISAP